MPIILWRSDLNDGWVFDGKVLNSYGNDTFAITPGAKRAQLAASGPNPLKKPELVAFLLDFAGKYNPVTKSDASWDFSDKCISLFKERCTIDLYCKNIDALATFPSTQAGMHDLVGGDGGRVQLKTGRAKKGKRGLLVSVHTSGGRQNQRQCYQPYPVGSFDLLVVYYIDWVGNRAHMWKFPESALIRRNILKTSDCPGKKTFLVYTTDKGQGKTGYSPDTWTFKYYTGIQPLNISVSAERMAKRFLDTLRSGN
jgi:hypothetical protein